MSSEFENKFYCVERSPIKKHYYSDWCGMVRIIRKDSGDVVYEKPVRYKKTPEEVEFDLDNWLKEKLKYLYKPLDWGLSFVISSLIRKLLFIKSESYGLFLESEEAASQKEAKIFYEKSLSYEKDELQKLKREIDKLSEQQKIELIAPTLEQINDPLRTEFEDLLGAKNDLYFVMGEPSGPLKEAFNKLEEVIQIGNEKLLEMHPELKKIDKNS